MKFRLTQFQKQLCNALQQGLPICRRPFAEIAKALESEEREVLQQASQLKELGVIRRICAVINYRALGMTGTLVATHVPPESLQEVTRAINSLENVSHNYQRNHYYNVWFTLRARTAAQIEVTLADLSGRLGVDFHSLPVKRVFKLDVRFDAESEGQVLLQGPERPCPAQPVEINQEQKRVISGLRDDLELTAEPFGFLCGGGLQTEDVLRLITELMDQGVICRIAAAVDHRKLGFVVNVLFAGQVPQDGIVQAGQRLARLPIVSHCYERQTFEGWPYNLFAMMHGQSMGQIQHAIETFTESEGIDSFQLLPTAAELKKQPVRHRFD